MAVDAARSEEGFTSATATRVMVAACREVGLDDRGVELIRLGENALFRLASAPVIVRVARAPEWLTTARKEVAVSRWLAEEGFSAARLVEDLGTASATSNGEAEQCSTLLLRLAQLGAALGIHLVVAGQRVGSDRRPA
ncbi:hypothetical protein [Streptomyces sviceus]|uniref:hypothetical protein n=1 Tax=Streptomyces sviceus TaxID=285530 RepID=UPI0036E2A486